MGFIEIDTNPGAGSRFPASSGLADIGNLFVEDGHRRRAIGTWLVGHAADWLRLGGLSRLLAYAFPDDDDQLRFLASVGFSEIVRTRRGWRLSTGN